MVDLVWNRASLVLTLICALIAGVLALRWAARRVPAESTPRRFVQALTVAGGVVGLIPGLFVGTLGGGDIGGAFVAIPFQFWLGLPDRLSWFIGMLLFMAGAVVLLALLGAAAGYSVGHYLGLGVQYAQSKLRRG